MAIAIDVLHPYTIIAIISSLVITFIVIYTNVRPRFPVYVRCWFCDYQSKVPYGNHNCWDCPDCEQYNGFSKDGDYNKEIPAQYDKDMNYVVGCKQDKFLVREEVLCQVCSEKQEAKLQQLAMFNCTNQKNFDKVATEFSQYLEEFYRLCLTCERKVEQRIREQDNIIWSRLNDSLKSRLFQLQTDKHFNVQDVAENHFLTILFSHVFHTLEAISSFCLAIRLIQLDTDQSEVMKTYIPQISTLHPYLLALDRNAWHLVISLILSGMLAKIILTQKRICKADLINSVFLLLVLISQSHLFPAFQAGSLLEASIFVGCHVTAVVCALISRRQNKINSKNDVKPVTESMSPLKFSCNQKSTTSSPSHSVVNQAIHTRSLDLKTRTTEQNSSCDKASTAGRLRQEAEPSLNYSYTVYKFESCNLGASDPTGTGRVSRPVSVCSQHSNKSTYAEALSSQTIPEMSEKPTRSPLISPSKFSPSSNLDHQRPILATHGLFSTQPKQGNSISHPKAWSHSSSSAFNPYSRSMTLPFVTRFGTPCYSLTSIYSDRHTGCHDKSDNSKNTQRSLHRNDSFKRLRDTITDIIDDISDDDSVGSDSDIDNDSVSDFTSVSQWCRRSVASQTTVSTRQSTPVHNVVRSKKGPSATRHKLYPWIMAAILLVLLPSVLTNGFIFT